MSFLGEIKRRKIFQVAAVYAVVAWLLVQIVATVEAPLSLPDWFDTAVIVLLGVGFPITLIISWAFNMTSEGVVRDRGHGNQTKGRAIEYVLIALLAVAIAWIGYRELGPSNGTAPPVLANSVAVLPCDNLSPDPNNAYFAASLHEEILNQLVKIRQLNVTARTSVLQYAQAARPLPEIASELNVESVMECSVSYADGRVAITAQLIDGATGVHRWSERYNREFRDIFDI
jgi:adenylate cyclase